MIEIAVLRREPASDAAHDRRAVAQQRLLADFFQCWKCEAKKLNELILEFELHAATHHHPYHHMSGQQQQDPRMNWASRLLQITNLFPIKVVMDFLVSELESANYEHFSYPNHWKLDVRLLLPDLKKIRKSGFQSSSFLQYSASTYLVSVRCDFIFIRISRFSSFLSS